MEQEKKETEILKKAKQAENLLANKDWKLINEWINNSKDRIGRFTALGIKDSNVYWTYVGKYQMILDFESYLKRLIDKKNGIIKKRNASSDKHNS